MKLTEFYNPDADQMDVISRTDTRKQRLTLKSLNKLRRIKEIKKAEEHEYVSFVTKMYGPGDVADTGGMMGGMGDPFSS
jgi:hypothetical protein